ncbi:GMC family oxidoreductase [Streptomyces milbemycinicus]|uniref:GMC family oxidoreductase n=1 Tax=Streptomyces milbemycinicus TaxID=476552 RepID=A0ABW8LHB5_9ACTN
MAHTNPVTGDREVVADAIRPAYDFIVCGGGTSGSVVARRLSDNPEASVLLLEAGGSDRVPSVVDCTLWMSNIGSERDWGYHAQPSPSLNGRTPPLPMGKVLGGGSSINASVWARGHRNDFDFWAEESGDPGWSYASVLDIYRRVENWTGPADPRRGTGGPLRVSLPENPVPLASALVEAASGRGIPAVADLNADPMESDGGCGCPNLLVGRGNARVSVAAGYLHPVMGRPNLDIVLCAEVTRLELSGSRATGVEFIQRGHTRSVRAREEVVLSLGAINTPKLLMLSGIGDQAELAPLGIPGIVHLPGVGKNLQDHILLAGCIWEYRVPEAPRNNAAEFAFFTKSDPQLPGPDLMPVLDELPLASEVLATQYDVPSGADSAWTLAPGLARPASRGSVRLASANALAAPRIDANFLSAGEDVKALEYCVGLCREIGNSPEVKPFVKREVMPGPLSGDRLEAFVRNAAGSYFHETCTAKMGRDEMSVVDSSLRVYGVEGLRIADGSIMPRVTSGNTMAPCVVIGERAADLIASGHGGR